MGNEFKHKPAGTQLTRTEDDAVGRHIFDSQATGDIMYASSTTQLRRLGVGSNGNLLTLTSGIPAWSSTIAQTITHTSGKSDGGTNFNVTVVGTGGAWQSGIYASVTQGSTKRVNGYISGAEFEVINSADNVGDWFPLVLNANNSGAQMGTHASFIALRDYGSLELDSLLWFGDQSLGSKSNTTIVTTIGNTNCTHAVRFKIGSTVYWLQAMSTLPSTT